MFQRVHKDAVERVQSTFAVVVCNFVYRGCIENADHCACGKQIAENETENHTSENDEN